MKCFSSARVLDPNDPNAVDRGPYLMTDTGGREVEVVLTGQAPKPSDILFQGRAVAIPDTHMAVYDIRTNGMVLVRKLEQPRRVLIVAEFTNEHDVRVLEHIAHQSWVKHLREVPPGPDPAEAIRSEAD